MCTYIQLRATFLIVPDFSEFTPCEIGPSSPDVIQSVDGWRLCEPSFCPRFQIPGSPGCCFPRRSDQEPDSAVAALALGGREAGVFSRPAELS